MKATATPEGWKCDAETNALFAKLEARLRPEIASRARKAEAMGVAEFDDAIQEARLALLNVVARFDPKRGDLERFARRSLRKALTWAIYQAKAEKSRRVNSLQPIEEVEPATPESELLDREFVRRLSERSEKCNKREREILVLSMEGLKRSEICRRLGLTKIQGEWAAGTLRKRLESFKTEVVCHG